MVGNIGMRGLKALAISVVIAFSAASATAGWDEGIAAQKAKQYDVAMKEFRALADQGDAAGQYAVGFMYYRGQGVEKNLQEAAAWYRKAAEQGYADAQTELAEMYESGEGVPRSDRDAASWYRKAAEQGDAIAQNNLGVMYANGRGVPKDMRAAVEWYLKAAEQGNARAQRNLGVRYYNGEGVTKNLRTAAEWYEKAAKQGDAGAQYNLGVQYERGEGVPQDFAKAAAWYREAAARGDGFAANNLGVAYANGRGVAQNDIVAYALYNLAAALDERGDSKAPGNRNALADQMSTPDIEQAQALTRRMMDPKVGVVAAIDAYLSSPRTKPAAAPARAAPKPVAATVSDDGFPARPAKRPGVTSCNTRCTNGSCLRTYDDGRKVRYQAEHKFNALSNQWEWDAGPC